MKELLEQLIKQYESIRQSGKYNMITQAYEIINIMDIDLETYIYIQKHYSELKEKYIK